MANQTQNGLMSTKETSREMFSLECTKPEDSRLINFHELEQHAGRMFRWSEPVSMIRLALAPGDYHVAIDTGCLRGEKADFSYQIHWNDHLIPPSAISVANGIIEFHVSSSLASTSFEQRLTISCKPLRAENGRRLLGMPICSVKAFDAESSHSPQILKFDRSQSQSQSGPSKKRSWFGSKTPEPTLPIWQIRIPQIEAVSAGRTPETHPNCKRVVVAPYEINSRHGVGLLIQYLIQDFSNVATVNSVRCYNDDRVPSRVHQYLPKQSMSRAEIYDHVYTWFAAAPPAEGYIVPYFKSDVLIGLALHDLFGTKILLHIMDDNCVFGTEIPQELCAEAFEKSDFVAVISPEMRQAYEQMLGKRAWLLPPIVPGHLVPEALIATVDQSNSSKDDVPAMAKTWLQKLHSTWNKLCRRKSSRADELPIPRGILIGNVWDRVWLEKLRNTIRESGLQLDWYSNNPEAVWLKDSTQDLAEDGIHLHPPLWGQDLVDELRCRPFAIMPSSELNGQEEREGIARLSLPSRLTFMIATAQLPLIAVGSPDTAASKFISRFDLGTTVSYDGEKLRQAVREICQGDRQVSIRQRAAEIAESFKANDVGEWAWKSLQLGKPADTRFEALFPAKPGEFSCFFDPEPPTTVHWSFRETWQMLNRLKLQNFSPEMVIDVGASTGVWSWTAASIFPNAKFVMVDPMMSRYDHGSRSYYLRSLPNAELVESALSDSCGETEILVSEDLYGTSLLMVDEKTRTAETTKVEVLTLDELARRRGLKGRTLLKIDVQYAEHLVLNGGKQFIRDHVDAVILELTIEREHPQAKTYREMLDFMDQLGFTMIDEMEGWRDPVTGRLEQKDSVFVRSELVRARKAA
jgi:FkbM family methyltransferase